MNYWNKPKIWWEYPLFGIGFTLFWILVPVWICLSLFLWRESTDFAIIHTQAVFYNPWLMWRD